MVVKGTVEEKGQSIILPKQRNMIMFSWHALFFDLNKFVIITPYLWFVVSIF